MLGKDDEAKPGISDACKTMTTYARFNTLDRTGGRWRSAE